MAKVDSLKERRSLPRTPAPFPTEVSPGIMGETVNLSETGLCLALEKPLIFSRIISFQINLPFSKPLESHGELIWTRDFAKNDRYLCGVQFLRLNDDKVSILREAIFKFKFLNTDFISLTKNLRFSLLNLKKRFDQFDAANKREEKRIKFVEKNKPQVYAKLTEYFNSLWEIVKDFHGEKYILHQRYCQKMLWYLLHEVVEINRYIRQKPLGYDGDFIIMNYFYDFYNKYLGDSSYEMLINSYTCNIPIASSVVKRKNFLKQKILEALKLKEPVRILSVGSGPVRELIELVQEGKITKLLYFDCLDFDKKALDYVRKEVEKIEPGKRLYLHLRLINKNLLDLIRVKGIEQEPKKYNFIYSAGVLDYLPNRFASRMLTTLYKFLDSKSILVICNADKNFATHRMYYEVLGKWVLKYRTKDELLKWAEDIQDAKEIKFENLGEKNPFLFLSLKKPS